MSTETKRVALLFGNGHYRHAAGLRDPVADVTDLSASLARAGYAVRVVVDADYGAMRAALRDYDRQADGAEAAIVYFAGYGMEMNGENWLVPVDAELRSESAVENEAVSLRSVISSVSNAQSFGLVILDAARANPFDEDMKRGKDGRSVSRGLVGVETPDNVFVAQSAKEGEVASDGAGRLSPFTAALVSHIGEPGLQIEYLFRDVRDEVAAATDSAQEPTLYGDGSDKPAYVVPAGETIAQGPPIAADQIAWSFLEGTNDVASLHAFSDAFPESAKQGQASARISALEGGTASPVLAVAVDADPAVEAPLLMAKGVGTAEDAAKLARRFKGDTAEVQKAWAVIAKVGDAKVSNAFQSLFPGVARRTVHAARRPSQAARVAGARRMPFHLARRAPVHSTLPVFVVRPRVTNNPLVALRDDAYAGRRPSPIKRVAARERDCEVRRWYRDVRQDFDDCGVPWAAERRDDGPVALYDPQAFGRQPANRDLTMAAGVIGPEPMGAPSPANGQAPAAATQASTNPVAAVPVAAIPGATSIDSGTAVGSGQAGGSPPAATANAPSPPQQTASTTVPTFSPMSVDGTNRYKQGINRANRPSDTLIDPGVAARETQKGQGPASGTTAPSSGKMPGSPTAAATASGSTDATAKPTGTATATGSAAKSTADETAKAPGSSAPSSAASTAAGSASPTTASGSTTSKASTDETAKASDKSALPTSASAVPGSIDPTAKVAGGGATTGSTGTAPTSTATTTAELPSKGAVETPLGGIGAAPTGTAVATTSTTLSPGALPTTSSQASPTSGTTALTPTAMSEVPPVSTVPVVVVAPTVTKPVTIISTGSSVPSDAPKTSSPVVLPSGPSTTSAPGVPLGSTALGASVHPPQDAPSSTRAPASQVSHVPNHHPSMTPAQPARSTAALDAPGPSTRRVPATAHQDGSVQTAALRSIPHLAGAAHDAWSRPAEHRATVDRAVREPTRAVVGTPVRLRPTFLVLHQAPRRELAPTRPSAIPQPFIRAVQRVAPPVRFAPPIQRIEVPRMVHAVVPQIQRIAIPQVQRIAVPQIQRIAVPQIQRIVIPTIGAAQIARPMMPMIRRPGQ